jgi:DNA-binding transcriptional MerR regulator
MLGAMNEMLSIGQFARAAGLSPRALRIYAESGLLPPAAVDGATGYRWYRPSQLHRAELIRLGRAAQMPLDELRALVTEAPDRAHERIDRHWQALAGRLGAVRAVVEQLHRMVDGDDPREVDMMDVQALVMYVDGMDSSRRFYGEHLGLPLVYEHHGRYAYQIGATRVLLHPRETGAPRGPGEALGGGLEVSLGVDDVDALVDRLSRAGVPVEQSPQDESWGERDAVVQDPDGLRVRLSQSLPDTWLTSR